MIQLLIFSREDPREVFYEQAAAAQYYLMYVLMQCGAFVITNERPISLIKSSDVFITTEYASPETHLLWLLPLSLFSVFISDAEFLEWLPCTEIASKRAVSCEHGNPALEDGYIYCAYSILTSATLLVWFNLVIDFIHVFQEQRQLRPIIIGFRPASFFNNCNIFIDYVFLTATSIPSICPGSSSRAEYLESQGFTSQCQTGHTCSASNFIDSASSSSLTSHEEISTL